MGHRIQRLDPCLVDRILEIENASFSHPWRREHFLHELSAATSRCLGMFEGEILAGFLIISIILDEGEILDFAVDPPFRGKGYGKLLLEEGIALCRREGVRVLHLEVRETATEARSLYRRLSFSETGRRRAYYEEGIDAIMMSLTLA